MILLSNKRNKYKQILNGLTQFLLTCV